MEDQYCAELQWHGRRICIADEISKNDHSTAHTFGRALVGERAHFSDVFVRGDRYSLVAAISKKGYIAAEVVQGSFDSYDFFDYSGTSGEHPG